MRRTKEEATATRNAILDVALDCFSKRGYTLTTFDDIATRIKLTKGAVFWHFKSKEELLAQLVAQEHERTCFFEGDKVHSLDELQQALLDWGKAILGNRKSKQFFIFVMSRMEWSEAIEQQLMKRLDGIVKDPYLIIQDVVDRLIKSGEINSTMNAEQLTAVLTSLFFGTLREALLRKRKFDIMATLEGGLSLLINAIRSK